MNNYIYRKIFLALLTLRIFCVLISLYFEFAQLCYFLEWNVRGSILEFNLTLFLDTFSLLFLSVVLFISSNVVIYSQSYLNDDIFKERFILLVLGFVISIMILIISPNIFSILLGWDGLGLVSYCLVIYYPTKKSRRAGILTVLRNRVGDVCLLISIAWFRILGDFNFFLVVEDSHLIPENILPLIIVLAAITKSAQIPFSAWLPAAIAAPTPVSALVHSSTLVTAGVYLLIRFSSFIPLNVSNLLLGLSVLTMFIAGLVASFEFDLKKIIALSTLSQLGVIIFSISLGLYNVALFHLLTHALFKALLFLCAGVIIHGSNGSQDIRTFGGKINVFPIVAVCLNLANLSLCGLPFLSGFYSKDIVVELAIQGNWSIFLIIILYLSLGLTVYYSFRLTFYTLVSFPQGCCFTSSCDSDKILLMPITFLTIIALLSGPVLNSFIFYSPSLIFLPIIIKILTFFLITIVIAYFVFFSFILFPIKKNWKVYFQGGIWILPYLSGQGISLNCLNLGSNLNRLIDQGWLEWLTVGVYVRESQTFHNIEIYNSITIKMYLLGALFWIIFIFTLYVCFCSLKF